MNLALHHKAVFCVKNCRTSEKEMILVLEEIDKNKTYLAFGKPSLWRYCVETLGLTESETYRFIQVSRTSAKIPELKEAILSGNLSVGKASRITSVITPENQDTWIPMALTSTHREIEREIRQENPKPIPKERIKVLTPTRSELRLSISIELEQKLKRAFEVSHHTSMEEMLNSMTDFYLKRKDKLQKAERIQKKKDKKQSTLHLQGKSETSHPSTPTPREKTASDPSREVPMPIQNAVVLRDRGQCQFKDCKETKFVQIHHIKPYSQGGKHTLDNLTTLCSAHHKMMHEHHSASHRRAVPTPSPTLF